MSKLCPELSPKGGDEMVRQELIRLRRERRLAAIKQGMARPPRLRLAEKRRQAKARAA